MTIKWVDFLLVFGVSLLSAGAVVSVFALGLRLLAPNPRPRIRTLAANACFVICALGVLYGIYLVVPALH